jgi:uncharacterized protein (UPF0261 family)
VGITSLGKSCLRYRVDLTPALEARGYEVAVFHTTGMGGRAFDALARAGRFCAVTDFSLQELANHIGGSVVASGPDRLTGAGASKVAQRDGRLIEMYMFVALVYFAICLLLSYWVKRLQARLAVVR